MPISTLTAPYLVVLGGGGHGKVVVDALLASEAEGRLAILDERPELHGTELFGVTVLGGDELLTEAASRGFTHFVCGVGGARDNMRRRQAFEKGLGAGLTPHRVTHPAALLSSRSSVGRGTVALAGVTINAGAHVGDNVILNTRSIVEHDCRVGDHAHIGPGAILSGGAIVENSALIGAGAVLAPGVRVGESAVVGAGAVVLKNVAAGERVAGVPATPLNEREPGGPDE